MTEILAERMAAKIEGDFVVFMIGARVNKLWKIHKWLPVVLAMGRMRKELDAHPEIGALGSWTAGSLLIQYWRSFEQLEAYARAKDKQHLPAWVDFNRSVGNSRGDVGIWHETFLVRNGEYESVYSGMPRFGLGLAGTLVSARGQLSSARARLRGQAAPALPEIDGQD
jgi:hypothetical protein